MRDLLIRYADYLILWTRIARGGRIESVGKTAEVHSRFPEMHAGDALCAARLCQLELLRTGTTCGSGQLFHAGRRRVRAACAA